MSLVSASIPNLINGVSQQPPSLRLKTQAEVQQNGLSTVVEGLRKDLAQNTLRYFKTFLAVLMMLLFTLSAVMRMNSIR